MKLPPGINLSAEEMADVSAVISAIHMTGNDERAILAVHKVLEGIRERARASSPNGHREN